MTEALNPSSLQANIRCATSQPLTQHVSIAINDIETNIHHAQHYCASNGKMKVKKIAEHGERYNVGEKIELT